MSIRPDIIQCLRRLEGLDKSHGALSARSTKLGALLAEIEALRQRLPTAILRHYDQLRARNRAAIAPVKRGVCGACHLSMTRSSFADLHQNGGAISVCENCGVFIYLDDSEAGGPENTRAR